MRGDMSCWRIIAGEAGSRGRCVFSLLWFYLHSERFSVQPYSLSTAFSKPLLLSLCNEKWLKHTLDESYSPLSLLWTLHRFSLCKPGDGVFHNSVFLTFASPLFFFFFFGFVFGSIHTLPTHLMPPILHLRYYDYFCLKWANVTTSAGGGFYLIQFLKITQHVQLPEVIIVNFKESYFGKV